MVQCDMEMTFGDWLKVRRRQLDLTQKALAHMVGCGLGTLRKLENGSRRPSKALAARIGQVLHVSEEELPDFVEFARSDPDPVQLPAFAQAQIRPPQVEIPTPGQPHGSPPPHNLPFSLTRIIGRDSEIAELTGLLLRSHQRLITLVGVGGIGKTRLALQAAHSVVADFPDGVWLVELASLSDATLVPQAVAAVFDVREVEGRPILSLLQSYLRRRKLLLLLDNCEHLVDAAAQLAEALLSHCPQLQILATSREALSVTGETTRLVPPLSLPVPGEPPLLDTLMNSHAVRLFIERATTALPTFSLTEENADAVKQVCLRLDGIPLAIEMAAAWVKLLRVGQIAARLDDRFRLLASGSRSTLPRHQTLSALLDWSYALLTPAEKRLLRWLAIFAGGFSLDAVEAVWAEKDKGDALEKLAQLVNKSLVVTAREPGQETHYRLLETIRQYAWVKLAEAGEAGPARDGHLAFFLQLVETAEPKLQSGEQLVWLDRLEAEHDNLRGALAWSLENPDGDAEQEFRLVSGIRLATALVPFWIMHAHLREGRRWLDLALERRHGAPPPVRARLLCNAGQFLVEQWEDDPTTLLQESLAIYRQLDDKAGMAGSLCWLGWCDRRFRHDLVAATPLWKEGLTLARQVDDKPFMTRLYHGLAWLAVERGDGTQATELSRKVLALAQESGDRREKLRMLFILGQMAVQQCDYGQAAAFFHETLVLIRELQDKHEEASVLNLLGETARCQRAYEQAIVFYHESLSLYRELNSGRGIAIISHNLGLVALGQGDKQRAKLLFREGMALAQEDYDREDKWLANVWGLARVALAEGQVRRAAQLFAAVEPMMQDFTYGIKPVDQDDYVRDVALARAQLGDKAYAAAWAEGKAMSLKEAVALALRASTLDEP